MKRKKNKNLPVLFCAGWIYNQWLRFNIILTFDILANQYDIKLNTHV